MVSPFVMLYVFLALSAMTASIYASVRVRRWAVAHQRGGRDDRQAHAPDSNNNHPDSVVDQVVLPATVLFISNTMLEGEDEMSNRNSDSGHYNNDTILRMFPQAEPTRSSMLGRMAAVGRINSVGPSTDLSTESTLTNNTTTTNNNRGDDGASSIRTTQRTGTSGDVVAVSVETTPPQNAAQDPFGWPFVVRIGGRHASANNNNNNAYVRRSGGEEPMVFVMPTTNTAPYGHAEYAVAAPEVVVCNSPHNEGEET